MYACVCASACAWLAVSGAARLRDAAVAVLSAADGPCAVLGGGVLGKLLPSLLDSEYFASSWLPFRRASAASFCRTCFVYGQLLHNDFRFRTEGLARQLHT